MINHFNFTNRVKEAGFISNLDSHHTFHTISKPTNTPTHLQIEKNQVKRKMKMSHLKYFLISKQKQNKTVL